MRLPYKNRVTFPASPWAPVPPAMLGMFGRKDSEAEHAKADLAKEHAELVKVKQDLEAERQVHFHGDDR